MVVKERKTNPYHLFSIPITVFSFQIYVVLRQYFCTPELLVMMTTVMVAAQLACRPECNFGTLIVLGRMDHMQLET